jgi:hypothetical protein
MEAIAPTVVPAPEEIRRTATEVLSRSDYRLGKGDEALLSFLERIGAFLWRLVRPVAEVFASVYEASPVLAVLLVIGLLAILFLLVAHIVYSFKTALGGRRRLTSLPASEDPSLSLPEAWEVRARDAALRADYTVAMRCLFRACVLRLTRARRESFRRAATNREYLRRFERTDAHAHLGVFVELIDLKWYGGGGATKDDYEACVAAHAGCYEAAGVLADAVGA